MSADRWKAAQQAKTLWQAHQVLSDLRPATGASPATWREYYQRSAGVYAEIAEVDRGHHHEALYWASRERAKADEIGARPKEDTHY